MIAAAPACLTSRFADLNGLGELRDRLSDLEELPANQPVSSSSALARRRRKWRSRRRSRSSFAVVSSIASVAATASSSAMTAPDSCRKALRGAGDARRCRSAPVRVSPGRPEAPGTRSRRPGRRAPAGRPLRALASTRQPALSPTSCLGAERSSRACRSHSARPPAAPANPRTG